MKNAITFLISLVFLFFVSIIQAQTITNVEPDTAKQCQKLTITITGENTNYMQGTSLFWLSKNGDDIVPESKNVLSPTQIEGTFYFNILDETGSYDVHTRDGNYTDIVLIDGFQLNAVEHIPELQNSSPDSVVFSNSFTLNITGYFTHFETEGVNNSAIIIGNGTIISAYNITVQDSTHLTADFHPVYNMSEGFYNLQVNNKLDDYMTLENALYFEHGNDFPELVSIEPDSGMQGEQLSVTVTGNNTTFQQGSSVLILEQGYEVIFPVVRQVINDTIITADFNFSFNNDTGYYNVVVNNANYGDLSLDSGFYLSRNPSVPSLLSIFPDSAYAGTTSVLIIKGLNTHFDKEDNGASIILKKDNEELYGHNTVAQDSVTLQTEFTFSFANFTGIHDLYVSTPFEGELELPQSFNLLEAQNNPAIVSVVPDSAFQGQTLTVTVTGKDIIFMQGTSSLYFDQNGFSIHPTHFNIVNDTVISGEFVFQKTDSIGSYNVIVDNGYAWPTLTLENGFYLNLFNFIGETEQENSYLTVYPNPSDGILFIKRVKKNNGKFVIKIYNLNGQILFKTTILDKEMQKQLNLTSFRKGIYLLEIDCGNKKQIERFVIQ